MHFWKINKEFNKEFFDLSPCEITLCFSTDTIFMYSKAISAKTTLQYKEIDFSDGFTMLKILNCFMVMLTLRGIAQMCIEKQC